MIVHNHYRSTAPSGETAVVMQESSGLRSLGHEVQLYERHSDEIEEWNWVRRAATSVDSILGSSSNAAFREAVRRFDPDVVHVHNLFPLISPQALRICAAEGVPVVATIHNYRLLCARGDFFRGGSVCSECANGNPLPALRHACFHDSRAQTSAVVGGMMVHRSTWRRLVSAYIFISNAEQAQLRGMALPEERTFVKWNLVPGDFIPPQDTLHQVAYVGRLESAKGVHVIMEAWERFRRSSPGSSLRLAIVGGGPMEREVAEWSRHDSMIDYYGLLTRAGVRKVLGQSRCVLLPSQWWETFGLVAVEAMAMGVAPIAANRGAFPELLGSDDVGVLLEPADAGAWQSAIRDVDERPERYREMGRRARSAYLSRVSPRENLSQLLDIYRYAINNPAPASAPSGK
jgi:glycosyltransferase involved in cell wall biosynthesis